MMSKAEPVAVEAIPEMDDGETVRVKYGSVYGGSQELHGEVDRVETHVSKSTNGGIFRVYVTLEGDDRPKRRLVVSPAIDDVEVQTKNGARWHRISDIISDATVYSGEGVGMGFDGLRADGGESVETLAGAVSDALSSSQIPLSTVSVAVGEVSSDVTVTANGHMARGEWADLRSDITEVLDSNGFQYQAKEAWAFVEVTGRRIRTDGGETRAREPGDVEMGEAHSGVKRRAITLEGVVMVTTGGESGEVIAVYRSEDAPDETLDQLHTLMDLSGYTAVDPYDTLDEDPGGVTGEGVILDAWRQKAMTDGGAVQIGGREDTPAMVAMDAVFSLVKRFGGGSPKIRPFPGFGGCTVEYSGALGCVLAEELEARGLETRHSYVQNGPSVMDRSGTISVVGYGSGGGGGE